MATLIDKLQTRSELAEALIRIVPNRAEK